MFSVERCCGDLPIRAEYLTVVIVSLDFVCYYINSYDEFGNAVSPANGFV